VTEKVKGLAGEVIRLHRTR